MDKWRCKNVFDGTSVPNKCPTFPSNQYFKTYDPNLQNVHWYKFLGEQHPADAVNGNDIQCCEYGV